MKTIAPVKVADIRYRVELKQHQGIVIYKSVSADGQREYETVLVNGKVSSCSCPAHQKSGVTCYIMRDVLAAELARTDRQRAEEKAEMDELSDAIAADVVTSEVITSEIETLSARIPAGTTIYRVDGRILFYEDLFNAWFCTCQEIATGASYDGCEHSARVQSLVDFIASEQAKPAPVVRGILGRSTVAEERMTRSNLNRREITFNASSVPMR